MTQQLSLRERIGSGCCLCCVVLFIAWLVIFYQRLCCGSRSERCWTGCAGALHIQSLYWDPTCNQPEARLDRCSTVWTRSLREVSAVCVWFDPDYNKEYVLYLLIWQVNKPLEDQANIMLLRLLLFTPQLWPPYFFSIYLWDVSFDFYFQCICSSVTIQPGSGREGHGKSKWAMCPATCSPAFPVRCKVRGLTWVLWSLLPGATKRMEYDPCASQGQSRRAHKPRPSAGKTQTPQERMDALSPPTHTVKESPLISSMYLYLSRALFSIVVSFIHSASLFKHTEPGWEGRQKFGNLQSVKDEEKEKGPYTRLKVYVACVKS